MQAKVECVAFAVIVHEDCDRMVALHRIQDGSLAWFGANGFAAMPFLDCRYRGQVMCVESCKRELDMWVATKLGGGQCMLLSSIDRAHGPTLYDPQWSDGNEWSDREDRPTVKIRPVRQGGR